MFMEIKTSTERGGYREIMNSVEAGEVDAVVVHEISRLARSLQALERTASRVTDTSAEIHFVRDGLLFGDGKEQPMYRLQMQMLGAIAEWQAWVKQMNRKEGIAARQQREDYHHGPALLRFAKDNGQLVEAGNYHEIVATLDEVQKEDLSKRKAAERLGCSRSTVSRGLERGELYGLCPND